MCCLADLVGGILEHLYACIDLLLYVYICIAIHKLIQPALIMKGLVFVEPHTQVAYQCTLGISTGVDTA